MEQRLLGPCLHPPLRGCVRQEAWELCSPHLPAAMAEKRWPKATARFHLQVYPIFPIDQRIVNQINPHAALSERRYADTPRTPREQIFPDQLFHLLASTSLLLAWPLQRLQRKSFRHGSLTRSNLDAQSETFRLLPEYHFKFKASGQLERDLPNRVRSTVVEIHIRLNLGQVWLLGVALWFMKSSYLPVAE